MPAGVATNIIVFGRGAVADGDGARLSAASAARVDAAVEYVRLHADMFLATSGQIVFSGGWAGAAEGMARPPADQREAPLMRLHAQAARIGGLALADLVSLHTEAESDSTLENVLRTAAAGYFDGVTFGRENPLGIVAHAGHAERIEYLASKAFGVPSSAIARILATGPDQLSGGVPEAAALMLTKVAFFGARRPADLRRRQRLLMGAVGAALRLSGRRRPPST